MFTGKSISTSTMLEMLSSDNPLFPYAVAAGVVVLSIISLFGLLLFAGREKTLKDVAEMQRKASSNEAPASLPALSPIS